jgi:hypothetical protein
MFPGSMNHLKILGARRIKLSKSHNGPTNIRCNRAIFSLHGDLAPGICAPLLKPTIHFRFPPGARYYSAPRRVQTGFVATPNLLFSGHRGVFPWGSKRPGRDVERSLPSSAFPLLSSPTMYV